MSRKTTRIAITSLVTIILLAWALEEFTRRVIGGFAGSYPFVEYWEFDASESEVVKAIKELKMQNPSLQPPGESQVIFQRKEGYNWNTLEMIEYKNNLKNDPNTPLPPPTEGNSFNDYWLYIDFYYTDTDEVVHTWTRPSTDSTKTTFAFVSLTDRNGDTSLINKDFWYLENKRQVNKFKENIVEKIQERLNEKCCP